MCQQTIAASKGVFIVFNLHSAASRQVWISLPDTLSQLNQLHSTRPQPSACAQHALACDSFIARS